MYKKNDRIVQTAIAAVLAFGCYRSKVNGSDSDFGEQSSDTTTQTLEYSTNSEQAADTDDTTSFVDTSRNSETTSSAVKENPAAGELVWVRHATTGSTAWGSGIAVMPNQSAIVTGNSGATITFAPGEENEISFTNDNSLGDQHIFVATYGEDGSLVFARNQNGIGDAAGTGVGTTKEGLSVVTGYLTSSTVFGQGEPNETTIGKNNYNYWGFIAQYSSSGFLNWVKSIKSDGDIMTDDIAMLVDGSALVIGNAIGNVTFASGEPTETLLNFDEREIFVTKYDTDGSLKWVSTASVNRDEIRSGIAGLSDSSFLIVGSCESSITFGLGEPYKTNLLVEDGFLMDFIAKYQSDGSLLWAKKVYEAPYDSDTGSSNTSEVDISLLADGSAIVTGSFEGIVTFGEGEENETAFTSLNGRDAFIAKYNTDGVLDWVKTAGGSDLASINAVAALADGSAVVAGGFKDSIELGSGEDAQTVLLAVGGTDIFIARYSPTGSLAWAKSAGGEEGDGASDIVLTSNEFAVITGQTEKLVTFGEGEPNETSFSGQQGTVFVAKYAI